MCFNIERFQIQPVAFFRSQREEADYFLAFHKEKKQDRYLLKIYTVKNSLQEDKITNEVSMNLKAQGVNQNIIKVKDPITQLKDKKVIILMQYVSQNLKDVIKFKKVADQNQYFTSQELIIQMKNLVRTFADLQRDNIAHRQIELESIYFVNQISPFLLGDFYHSKNLIGQQDSEIRQIDTNDVRQLRFPDKKSLECLLKGEHELTANYYKMDVYTLGIVFCQIASLEIYEDVLQFDHSVERDLQSTGKRYGRNVKEFINLMLSPREVRKDFIQLEEVMDTILDRESNNDTDARCSIFPADNNVLTVISEDNLRDDLSSSSSSNDLFQRDESQTNTDNLYQLSSSGSIPKKLGNKSKINGFESLPLSMFSQINSIDEQSVQQQQTFSQAQENSLQIKNQIQTQDSNNSSYNQVNQNHPSTPPKYRIHQNNKQKYHKSKFQMIHQDSDQNIKKYDSQQQSSTEKSIYQQQTDQIEENNKLNSDEKQLQTLSTVPKQQFIDEYSADYFYRSTKLKNQTQQLMQYEELVKKAKTQTNLIWFEKKKVKVRNSIGHGKLSEVFLCETSERNCCIVKMYFKKSNNEVWEMIQSLNVFNKIQLSLVIKIEGYYINPVKDNQYESELWVIQKQKKYNLITFQQRFNISFMQRLSIAKKLTQAIFNLHNSNPPIAHGDIKPQNILLDLQLNPFLTDFVVCESMVGPQLIKSRGFEIGYSAPEQFNDMQFCKNSDIWSLGNKVDSQTVNRFGLYDPYRQGCLDFVENTTNEPYRIITNLIKDMTQYNPDDRISLKQVMEQLNVLESACTKKAQQNQQKVRQSFPHLPIYQQSPSQIAQRYPQTPQGKHQLQNQNKKAVINGYYNNKK